jgi:hypothetical protein
MLAPAAFWGGAVPSAAQTAGMETGRAYDAATPSAIESIGIGLLMNRHTRGLQSGGMVGYSTFFTGYDAERHGFGRKISLGRLGAQAVSASARGLMHTPLANSERAASVLRPLTMAHKYGVGGALSSVQLTDELAESAAESADVAGRSRSFFARHGASPMTPGAEDIAPSPNATAMGPDFDDAERIKASLRRGDVVASRSAQEVGEEAAEIGSRSAYASAMRGQMDSKTGRMFKWLVGVLGGEGFNRAGTRASYEVAEETIDGTTQLFRRAGGSTAGAVALGGTAGRALGAAFRIGAGYEIARLAVDAGTYAAGEAYESMVETTSAIRERVGSDQSMSPAYYNRGAATERQRARRSLNLRSLNPRTQLMGNEASMAHG